MNIQQPTLVVSGNHDVIVYTVNSLYLVQNMRITRTLSLKQIGVTRLSLGIEHFDDGILEANGRAHLSPEIYQAYAWAREVDFPQINVDLIAGMLGETEEKVPTRKG